MFMKHDKHGLHDATGAEVEAMKKDGWYYYGYEAFYADVAKKRGLSDNAAQPQPAETGEQAQPKSQPAKRRGRPPRGE